jgi:23S rRNA (pseudouridine1915-N3)-methyltransferase
VGKPREPLCAGLHDVYAQRLARLGVGYEAACVGEVRPDRSHGDDHVREREARALFARLDARETVVALDAGGEMFDSPRLAEVLERWATPRATLIVGGPLGLHASVLERANHTWSLSPLTFPHELVRVLVAEQLYRAVTLRRGIPYHK